MKILRLKALVVGAVLATVLVASPSWAGQWRIRVEVSGNSRTSVGPEAKQNREIQWGPDLPYVDTEDRPVGLSLLSAPIGSVMSGTTQQSAQLWVEYISNTDPDYGPMGADDVPPPYSVLVTSRAEAWWGHNKLGTSSGTISPQSDPEPPPTFGRGYPDTSRETEYRASLQIKRELFQFDLSGIQPNTAGVRVSEKKSLPAISAGGQITVGEMPGETQYDEDTGQNNPVPDGNLRLSAYVGHDAKADTRFVTISSPNIDSSYRRTVDASQPVSKYRDQVLPDSNVDGSTIGESAAGLLNERSADGSMTADSVAVWDGPSNQWMGQGIYQANTLGFTSAALSWTLSGGDPTGTAQDELASSHGTINLTPYSGPFYDLNGIMLGGTASGSGIMGQTTLTLKATDSNGVEGNNTYAVNWHLPYQKEVDRADGPRMKELFWLSESFMNGNTSLQTKTAPAQSFSALAMIDDVLVLADAVGAPTEPFSQLVSIYKALTNISKWTDEAPEIEVTATGHPNTTDAFSAALRQWPENIQYMDVATRDALTQSRNYDSFSDYDVYVGRVRYHHEKSLLADKYDIHGFHSSNHVLKHDVTERIEFQNYYQLRGTSPVTPPAKEDTEVPTSYNVS